MPAKATEVFNEYMEFLEIKSEELEDFPYMTRVVKHSIIC